jgi:hypothetical protein
MPTPRKALTKESTTLPAAKRAYSRSVSRAGLRKSTTEAGGWPSRPRRCPLRGRAIRSSAALPELSMLPIEEQAPVEHPKDDVYTFYSLPFSRSGSLCFVITSTSSGRAATWLTKRGWRWPARCRCWSRRCRCWILGAKATKCDYTPGEILGFLIAAERAGNRPTPISTNRGGGSAASPFSTKGQTSRSHRHPARCRWLQHRRRRHWH